MPSVDAVQNVQAVLSIDDDCPDVREAIKVAVPIEGT